MGVFRFSKAVLGSYEEDLDIWTTSSDGIKFWVWRGDKYIKVFVPWGNIAYHVLAVETYSKNDHQDKRKD